jgi:hypothetical protein
MFLMMLPLARPSSTTVRASPQLSDRLCTGAQPLNPRIGLFCYVQATTICDHLRGVILMSFPRLSTAIQMQLERVVFFDLCTGIRVLASRNFGNSRQVHVWSRVIAPSSLHRCDPLLLKHLHWLLSRKASANQAYSTLLPNRQVALSSAFHRGEHGSAIALRHVPAPRHTSLRRLQVDQVQLYDVPERRLARSQAHLQDFQDFLTTRPTSEDHSAIYFPADENTPRFVWLKYSTCEQHVPYEELQSLGLSLKWIKQSTQIEVSHNAAQNEHVQAHHLVVQHLQFDKMRSTPAFKQNAALRKTDNELGALFRGPVLVWARPCHDEGAEETANRDLGPTDFRHAVEELRYVPFDLEKKHNAIEKSTRNGLLSVRVNCDGDCRFLRCSALEYIYESASAATLASEVYTPIADAIGLPLVVRRMPPALIWRERNRRNLQHMENTKARLFDPPDQPTTTGSLMVTRKDGKPLHPIHLSAIFGYTAMRLKDPRQPDWACILAEELQADRIRQVSREDFERYYQEMWNWPNHRQLQRVRSPFDLKGLAAYTVAHHVNQQGLYC